jgi:hypothetical protein
MKEKLSKTELEEMFQEGRFVARAFQVDTLSKGKPKYGQVEDELKYLNVKKDNEGEHQNVERHGQRGRSGTLLVPGVDMTLFDSVGFLYDADQSTIKAYMFRDSQTMSQINHSNYYNVNIDKKKFEPIISRTEFMDKYREYREKLANPELRDGAKNYELEQSFEAYNEVLGNFFPESLVSLVGKDSSLETKGKLLFLKNLLSERGQDLPMVLMDKGQIKVWNPSLHEIAEILNDTKSKIEKDAAQYNLGTREELLKEHAKNLGFTLDDIPFGTPITAKHLKVNNQYEFKANEIIDYLSEVTKIPKGGTFSYGIEGRLLEVVNQKLKSEGQEPVKDLKGVILNKKDVENLVTFLNAEMKTSKDHKEMSSQEIKDCSAAIVSNINARRSDNGESLANVDGLTSSKSSKIGRAISEFFTKVASFFKENVVSEKVENCRNIKEQLTEIKQSEPTISHEVEQQNEEVQVHRITGG